MDNISEILVPLIIIASLIVQIANKKQKQSRKRESLPDEEPRNATDWPEVLSEVFDVPAPSRTPVLREPERAEVRRPEQPEAEPYRPLRKNTARPAQAAASKIRQQPHSEIYDAPDSEQESALKDFDIRKAVLYAEILNPKYKEF